MNGLLLKTIASSDVLQLTSQATMLQAAALMSQERVSSIVVTSADGHALGIVTEHDVVRAVHKNTDRQSSITALMSTPLLSVPQDISIEDAYQLTEQQQVHHLVLLDDDGHAVGIVSDTDFLRHFDIASFIGEQPVNRVMKQIVAAFPPAMPLSEACDFMLQENETAAIIVDEHDCPIGIVTERDIVRGLASDTVDSHTSLHSIMMSPVITMNLDATVLTCSNMMMKKQLRHLVIVDNKGRYAGIVTQHDLVQSAFHNVVEVELEAERQQLFTLLDTMTEAVWLKDTDGVYQWCNRTFANLCGCSVEEVLGKSDEVIFNSKNAELRKSHHQQALVSNDNVIANEALTFVTNIQPVHLDITYSPLRDRHGKVINVLGVARELTKRAVLKEKLEQSHARYNKLVEQIPIGVFSCYASDKGIMNYDYVSPTFCRIVGIKRTEIYYDVNNLYAIVHPNERWSMLRKMRSSINNDTDYFWQGRIKVNGEYHHIISEANGHKNADGVVYLSGIIRDVTEQQQLVSTLLQRDAILSVAAEVANYFLSNPQWRTGLDAVLGKLAKATNTSRVYIFENETSTTGELFTSYRHEWVNAGITSHIDDPALQHVAYQQLGFARWQQELAKGHNIHGPIEKFPAEEQLLLRHQNIQSLAVVPIMVDKHWWGFIGFDDCVNDRNWSTAEMDLLMMIGRTIGSALQRYHLEEELKAILEAEPECVKLTDTNGRIVQMNSSGIHMVEADKLSQVLGMEVEQLIAPEFRDQYSAMNQRVLNGTTERLEFRIKSLKGTLRWMETVAVPFENPITHKKLVLSVTRDINDRKRHEQREKIHNHVLQLLASGEKLSFILNRIIIDIEQRHPDLLMSILLVDDKKQHFTIGAAPTMNDMCKQKLCELDLHQDACACIEAMQHNDLVVIEDVGTDSRCTLTEVQAENLGIITCWAQPIMAVDGEMLGTVTINSRQHDPISEEQINLIKHVATLASIAVERHKAQESLRLAASVFKHSSEAIAVTDGKNNIIATNPAFEQLTGYTFEDVKGKNPKLLSSGRQSQDFYKSMWQSINASGKWQGEIWNRRKDGVDYIEWLTINTIYDEQEQVHRRIALFSDITEKKRSEALILKQANFDPLTQLPNRSLFRDRLTQEMKRAQRERHWMALFFIDLDRFKEVNDTLGHHIGDMLLIEAANRIKSCVRDTDTVARLGGDEFTVILPDLDDIADISRIAQKIIDVLKQPFNLDEQQIYIAASIGITVYPSDAQKEDDLLRNADQAMYDAKQSGRACYRFYTDDMYEVAQQRMQIANDLRIAKAAGQLEVYYQPVVDFTDDRIVKAEALLRWRHPSQGFISPATFIPIAEETGLILDIGNWVFYQVASRVKQWQQKYDSTLQIAINKSPVQFNTTGQRDCDQRWLEYMTALDLDSHSIVLEITEGLLLEASDRVASKLLNLRDAGIEVALDDFGTGYSSLAYLQKFDIDYIKIDQSFVAKLDKDEHSNVLVETIIVMAHKLGMKVIAEGVETILQCNLLKQMGCDYAQGYLFSKPVPADEFETLLAQQKQSHL